jgi:hypothetical protein
MICALIEAIGLFLHGLGLFDIEPVGQLFEEILLFAQAFANCP